MAIALRSSSVSGAADTNGTSCVVPVPTGAAVGDIALIAMEHWDTFDGTGITFPAGFTVKVNGQLSGTREKLYVAWKRLTAADTGNYTVTWTTAQWNMGHCLMISGAIATGDPIENFTSNFSTSTGLPSMSVGTSGVGRFMAHFIANENSASGTPPTGPVAMTEAQDGNYLKSNYVVWASSGTFNPSGGATSVSTAKSGGLLAVLPAAGGGAVSLDAVGSASAGFTGAAAADRPIAANSSAASGFTGLAGAARPIAGQGTAAAHFTGTAAAARALTATASAAAGFTGDATFARGLASNASSSAGATGDMSVARGLGASSPSASSFQGALAGGAQKDLDGSGSAAGSLSGTASVARGLDGSAGSASDGSGTMLLGLGFAGSISAAADAVGDLSIPAQSWRLVMPPIIERFTFQGMLSTTMYREATVFGDENGLFTVERGAPAEGTDEYGAIPFGTRYIWYGGHVNVTDDPAVRNLWLAHGFEVESVLS